MDTPITRAEHLEFAKRMEDEHHRQNKRITKLEVELEENNKLLVTIHSLAKSMEAMQKEQEKQGERLEILENRDGDMWRTAVKYVLSAVIGGVIVFIFTQLGM